MANGGTLFLDEIGDISLNMQLKLLRVLQEGEFERVGGTETIRVDVRIIAATNKNLEHAMEDGSFRQDLYYRLNVIPIVVPPLRERKDDIKYLVYHFVEKFNKIYARNIVNIEPRALELMENYSFPGNIRELENLIERILVLSKDTVVSLKDLPDYILGSMPKTEHNMDLSQGLTNLTDDFEKMVILKALKENDYNKQQTAKVLNINRTTFMSKLKKYNIN
jgi:two-component system response regulator AtoC